MLDEISISVATAKTAGKFLAKNSDHLTNVVRSIMQTASEKILLHSRHCYKTYLEKSIELNSNCRSFFFRASPVNIYNFFVSMDIEHSSNVKKEASITDVLQINNHTVIQASAGYGKSIFLRHLFLTSIETCNYVPILFDLRNITENKRSLLESMHDKMYGHGFEQDIAFLTKGLEFGHFLLLLDGFDEISPENRSSVAKEFNFFATKYSKSPIVVTSRPDNSFTSWEKFSVVKLSPLSRKTAVELVRRTPEEDELKDKFIQDLEENLFEKHDTFLRNPLLLSIMVLTYTKSANVPTKISLFYDNAYHALFEGHDALKGGFQRQRKCQLDVLDFSKIFASFCIQTYNKQEYSISRIRALEVAARAIADQKFQIEASDFLDDCLQSVCLLVEDGLLISFSHRSFQEYFVAKFISKCPDSSKKGLIERVDINSRFENVLPILWEIDEYAFEKHYLLPRAKELFDKIGFKSKVGQYVYVRFMRLAFSEISLHNLEKTDYSLSFRHRESSDSSWRWTKFVEDKFKLIETIGSYNGDVRRSMKCFVEKEFGREVSSTTMVTNDIPARSEFWVLMGGSSVFFGKIWLEKMHDIYVDILNKHDSRDSEIIDLIK